MPSTGALDSTETFVGAGATVYIGDADTAPAPTDADSDPGTGWFELGHTAQDGISVTDGKNLVELFSHQSFYPIRRLIDSRTLNVNLTPLQWNEKILAWALSGGEVAGSAPDYTITPPAPGTIDERAMVIDFVDGSDILRWYLPRGVVSGDVEMSFSKSTLASMPITFGVVTDDTTDPYQIFFHGTQFGAT